MNLKIVLIGLTVLIVVLGSLLVYTLYLIHTLNLKIYQLELQVQDLKASYELQKLNCEVRYRELLDKLNHTYEKLSKLEQAVEYFKEASEMLITITDRLMRSLMGKNLILANKVLNALREYGNYIKKYHILLFKSYGLDEIYLVTRSVLEKLAWAATSIEGAVEVTFDISVANESPVVDVKKLDSEVVM